MHLNYLSPITGFETS